MHHNQLFLQQMLCVLQRSFAEQARAVLMAKTHHIELWRLETVRPMYKVIDNENCCTEFFHSFEEARHHMSTLCTEVGHVNE